jgi:hypothetical protein
MERTMKAVDYLKRFDHIENIIEYDRQEVLKIIDQILVDFFLEAVKIIKQREVKLDHAVISVIKEQDIKFHSLCKRLEKKYGRPVLKYNAFISCMIQMSPELSQYLTEWK